MVALSSSLFFRSRSSYSLTQHFKCVVPCLAEHRERTENYYEKMESQTFFRQHVNSFAWKQRKMCSLIIQVKKEEAVATASHWLAIFFPLNNIKKKKLLQVPAIFLSEQFLKKRQAQNIRATLREYSKFNNRIRISFEKWWRELI